MEDEKGNCKKCDREIGGHNIYLHEGFCDKCFFETFFPEPDHEKAKKEIENQKGCLKAELQEFLGKNEIFFERKFGLQKYFEILAVEHKKAKRLLFEFLQLAETENFFLFTLYDGFVTNVLEINKKGIEEKFLSAEVFEEPEDSYVSYSISDLQSFYLTFGEGTIFLSSNQGLSEICEKMAKELKLEYTMEETKDFADTSENIPL